MNAMEETHLTIETLIDGKRIGMQDINERVKLLWTGRILFEIKVRGDHEAHRQWFRTDKLPRSGHESEASQTLSNAAAGEQSAPSERAEC